MEIWKDIPGFEGQYQASTQGRIRSIGHSITQIGRGGKPFTRFIKGRILKPGCSKSNPHLFVVPGKNVGSRQVHQLVALTFLGPPPDGMEVRHLDGNAQNNCIENLKYGTRTENILDVYTVKPWRKLTLTQAAEIKQRALNGESTKDLAKEYGISQGHVCGIKAGRVYAWLQK